MDTEENGDFFAAEIDAEYMIEAQPSHSILHDLTYGCEDLYYHDPEEGVLPSDAPTSLEHYSEYSHNPLEQQMDQQEPAQEPENTHREAPSMKVFVTAYYKTEGKYEDQLYLPRERDLILSLSYSPQSHWESKKVTFPTSDEAKESFYVKRKDPEHLGEIVLNSAMNVHAISIEKVGEDVRTDALRKRQQRNKSSDDSGEEHPTKKVKRRQIKNEEIKAEVDAVVSKCDRKYTLRVSVGEISFSRTFEIRTARDLNKYRYLRKCVELYEEK